METSNTPGRVHTGANVCRIIGCVVLGIHFAFSILHVGNVLLGFFVQLAFGDTSPNGLPHDFTAHLWLMCVFVALFWAVRPSVFAGHWRWRVALTAIALACLLYPAVASLRLVGSNEESWVIGFMVVPAVPVIITLILWTIAGQTLRQRSESAITPHS